MNEGDVQKFFEANKNILGPDETVKLYNPLIDNLKTYRPDLLITGGLSKGIGLIVSWRMGIPGFYIDLQASRLPQSTHRYLLIRWASAARAAASSTASRTS